MIYLIGIVLFLSHGSAIAQVSASGLFSSLKYLVFQIRVVDLASGEKSSLGSGFQISKDGHIATNFHVISAYVHEPEKYRVEYITKDNQTNELDLKGIDIVHDLAILKTSNPEKGALIFNTQPLKKGDRLYSMGNPLDLGMTIIEGNYNGLLKLSRYQKILFSGSLNAGMSGGPAVDEKGNVIGINVAKGGEQISFLVPAVKLIKLLSKVMLGESVSSYDEEISKALMQDQSSFYNSIITQKWNLSEFQKLKLPKDMAGSLKCWGHTADKEGILYNAVHQHCKSQDQIYINNDFYTGGFYYDYEWIESDELNRFQLYSLLQDRFKHIDLSNASDEEDVTNYVCDNSFIDIDDSSWKISSCVRRYKKYEGLYDFTMILASLELNNGGAIIKVGASGIDQNNITRFTEKFINSISWIH